MGAQVLRRILGVVPVLLGVSIVVFAILRLVPGDPVVALYGAQGASPAPYRTKVAQDPHFGPAAFPGRAVWAQVAAAHHP